MEVYFATKKLGETLSSDKRRVRAYGAVEAKRISQRLSELAYAGNLEALRHFPGGCHQLRGDRAGQLAVDLTRSLRLVFRPTDNSPPAKPDGGLDWSEVTAVTIVEVTDYHGA